MHRSGRTMAGTGACRSATPCTSSTQPTTEPKEASMKRALVLIAGLTAFLAVTIGLMAATARTSPAPRPQGRPVGPAVPSDTGAGERRLAVVGGGAATRGQ